MIPICPIRPIAREVRLPAHPMLLRWLGNSLISHFDLQAFGHNPVTA
jgi:hypothetical protein